MKKSKIIELLIGGVILATLVLAGCIHQGLPEEKKEELKLSDFPEAFRENSLIVVGDNASEIEMQAANEIAEYLKKKTGNKPLVKRYSEVSDEDRRNYNLIVVGTPRSNEMLEEIYEIADVLKVNETFPGEGKGILEIARNPWNEEGGMLLVKGNDKWEVENIENKQIKQMKNANFSIKAKKYSSTLSITNTGNVVLTNIKIIKDREFTKEGVIIHEKIIKIIPKLDINESVNISIPEISSCGFLPEEEDITASNEGWIIVTCDQGITKKIAFCEVIPHTIKRYPIPLEFFVFYILPPVLVALLVIGIIRYISRIRGGKR